MIAILFPRKTVVFILSMIKNDFKVIIYKYVSNIISYMLYNYLLVLHMQLRNLLMGDQNMYLLVIHNSLFPVLMVLNQWHHGLLKNVFNRCYFKQHTLWIKCYKITAWSFFFLNILIVVFPKLKFWTWYSTSSQLKCMNYPKYLLYFSFYYKKDYLIVNKNWKWKWQQHKTR